MGQVVSRRAMRRVLMLVALLSSASFAAQVSAPPESVPPWESFQQLREGNERFAAGRSRTTANHEDARRALVKGQKPHTILVSCSDSRVPPELVFDQGLGELFIVREAGNGLDDVGLASIEFAMEQLGARLIVVMGHEYCGAVKAALATPEGTSAGSSNLDALVASIHENMRGASLTEEDREDPKAVKASWANVNGVVRHLLEGSELVRKRVEAGEVIIVPGLYSLETGRVRFWDADKVGGKAPVP